HTCAHTDTCTHIHTRSWTHTHTPTHTCTHTWTHMHILIHTHALTRGHTWTNTSRTHFTPTFPSSRCPLGCQGDQVIRASGESFVPSDISFPWPPGKSVPLAAEVSGDLNLSGESGA
ncbi:PREDICTED: LOW QUALITY PROTEIN: putative uncharacterized protein FLJ46204, partial [Colobus angolensis palliatus]|uniref:LOW QUALITY PROTEIN: putative uncharacterized protein FLJ46204 n=1 Tax=Colobus angolensis palliatus TaxID=336983 RepID=UPI0005F4AF32